MGEHWDWVLRQMEGDRPPGRHRRKVPSRLMVLTVALGGLMLSGLGVVANGLGVYDGLDRYFGGSDKSIPNKAFHPPPCLVNGVKPVPKAHAMAVDLLVERSDEKCQWAEELSPLPPRRELKLEIRFLNSSPDYQGQVAIKVALGNGLSYVPGTTKLYNSTHPRGITYDSDSIAGSGIVIGSYTPDSVAYVTLGARLEGPLLFDCGFTRHVIQLSLGSGSQELRPTTNAVLGVARSCPS